jgi:hypothetical protein
MKLLSPLVAFALLLPTAALAGPASDAVRFFYDEPTFEPDPSVRDHFVDPAKTKFEQNDALSGDGDAGCIDWVLAIDAQDFDDATLKKTLKLEESVNGDEAEVEATFTLFPDDKDTSTRDVLWTLKDVDGDWKVADIESKTSDWKLSELDCQ